MRKGTVSELGRFKEQIKQMLYADNNIHEILYGENEPAKNKFTQCVKSHLFADDTKEDKGTYIYFDTYIPATHTNTKQVNVVMYCICHRDLIDNTFSKEGFFGNRSDILTQMVENCLCDPKNASKIGIDFQLMAVDLFNTLHYSGTILTFTAECFR